MMEGYWLGNALGKSWEDIHEKGDMTSYLGGDSRLANIALLLTRNG